VSMRALRVLIAEEDPAARKQTVALILSKKNIESCDEAANCRGAVAKCRTFKPHVVVMSAKLPAMDALQAVEEIKKFSPRTQILLLGTESTKPLEKELERIGEASWVTTPALLLNAIDVAEQCELLFYEETKPGRTNCD
jgi:chemotaxis response regulator CheB